MNAFPIDSEAEDPRDGRLTLTPEGNRCHIEVEFRLDRRWPEAKERLANLYGDWVHFRYTVDDFDSKRLGGEIARAISHLCEANHGAFRKHGRAFSNDAELESALRPSADLGRQIFVSLFQLDPGASRFSTNDLDRKEWESHGSLLRRWLTETKTVEIVAPSFYLPWGLLYPENPSRAGVDPWKFWGFSKDVTLRSPGLAAQGRISLDWNLSAAIAKWGLEHHDAPDHPFVVSQSRVERRGNLQEFFDDLSAKNILYFYGHASGATLGEAYGSVVLNDERVTAFALQARLADPDDIGSASFRPQLIFLNGCCTGAGAEETSTIPDVLVKARPGQFCFVSTVGEVPAWAAAECARKMLSSFFGDAKRPGKSLGASLREAREQMLAEYRSPIGILYAIIGKLSCRITEPVIMLERNLSSRPILRPEMFLAGRAM